MRYVADDIRSVFRREDILQECEYIFDYRFSFDSKRIAKKIFELMKKYNDEFLLNSFEYDRTYQAYMVWFRTLCGATCYFTINIIDCKSRKYKMSYIKYDIYGKAEFDRFGNKIIKE